MSSDEAETERQYRELNDEMRRSRRTYPQFIVIDWDRENLVGAAYSAIVAQDIKTQYCNEIGIAPDGQGPDGRWDEPRFRVTIERSEVK